MIDRRAQTAHVDLGEMVAGHFEAPPLRVHDFRLSR
jgi:hypothetical protein